MQSYGREIWHGRPTRGVWIVTCPAKAMITPWLAHVYGCGASTDDASRTHRAPISFVARDRCIKRYCGAKHVHASPCPCPIVCVHREGYKAKSPRPDGRYRDAVPAGPYRSWDQETIQPPPFQQPAPGNLMALSGVMARKLRRICSSS
jgi:hypothetical protein